MEGNNGICGDQSQDPLHAKLKRTDWSYFANSMFRGTLIIPDKKRNASLRTFQLSGISQLIGQFSLYQFKGMQGTAA